MTYVIDFEKKIDLKIKPRNETERKQQEMYVLCSTAIAEVPLYREFGLDKTYLSMPMSIAQTLVVSAIAEAARDFMPDLRVDQIYFRQDAETPEHMISRIEVTDDEQ